MHTVAIHDIIEISGELYSISLRRGNDYVIRRNKEEFDRSQIEHYWDRWMQLALQGEPGYAHFSIPTQPVFDVN